MNGKDTLNRVMRVKVEKFNIRDRGATDGWVAEQVARLGHARRIDAANIRIAHSRDESPAFEVKVHLETPGPDLFVESRDHTLRAAFAKAISTLRAKIASRAMTRLKAFSPVKSRPRLLRGT